eukprot:TRINITY_DN3310_c2_g1_i2.p1 TRINITY_DN3310_c2_g1~~TRINITY_DN3310_c2_g1_i2.p1  ORF type:complete len:721 (+),score=140.69 TRINITY_DN3310_c2_g1_i2:160-2322(+)
MSSKGKKKAKSQTSMPGGDSLLPKPAPKIAVEAAKVVKTVMQSSPSIDVPPQVGGGCPVPHELRAGLLPPHAGIVPFPPVAASTPAESPSGPEQLKSGSIDMMLDLALSAFIDAVVVANIRGIILGFNQAACRMFGYGSASEVLGKNLAILMPSNFADNHDGFLRRYAGGAAPKLVGTTRRLAGLRKDGKTFPLDISLGFTKPAAGDESIFIATIRDVTENEEQLRAKSRYKGEFDELELLGSGGFGSVFRVRNRLDLQEYAVKKVRLKVGAADKDYELNSELSASQRMITIARKHRYVREVMSLAKIARHPNVVCFFNAWIEENVPVSSLSLNTPVPSSAAASNPRKSSSYGGSGSHESSLHDESCIVLFIQMELARNALCLGEWLFNRDVQAAEVDVEKCLSIFHQIVDGLEHIHQQGFVHRDIKPDNVFVQADGHVLIGDFGLAKNLSEIVPPTLGVPQKKKPFEVAQISEKSGLPDLESDRSISDFSVKDSSTQRKRTYQRTASWLDVGGGVKGLTTGCGSLYYAAPEQREVRPEGTMYNQSADIFSLGILLFELFQVFFSDEQRELELGLLSYPVRGTQPTLPREFIEKFPNVASLILEMARPDAVSRINFTQIRNSRLLVVGVKGDYPEGFTPISWHSGKLSRSVSGLTTPSTMQSPSTPSSLPSAAPPEMDDCSMCVSKDAEIKRLLTVVEQLKAQNSQLRSDLAEALASLID